LPTLQVKIHNFIGTTVVSTMGDRHKRRDVTAMEHCMVTAELIFSPDHIWFWIDRQEGEDYKANVEVKWVERNLVLFNLVNGDGVKGDVAKVANPDFKGHIDSLPPPVTEEYQGRQKTNSVYHVYDFTY